MKLDAAQFEWIACGLSGELIGAPKARESALSPPAEQRRAEPRVSARAHVTVMPLNDNLESRAIDAPLRDFSAGGIGFLYTRKMLLDEQFVVLLPEGRESVAVLCQVAYYQPLGEHVYAVGAKFVRVLRRPTAAPERGAIAFASPPLLPRRAAS